MIKLITDDSDDPYYIDPLKVATAKYEDECLVIRAGQEALAYSMSKQNAQKFIDLIIKEKEQSMTPIKGQREQSMLKDLIRDLREFVLEHRSTIYTLGLVLLVDHYVFNGAFRERIKDIVDNLLVKVEKKVEKMK